MRWNSQGHQWLLHCAAFKLFPVWKKHCVTGEITCDPVAEVHRILMHVTRQQNYDDTPDCGVSYLREFNCITSLLYYHQLFLWDLFYTELPHGMCNKWYLLHFIIHLFPHIDIWDVTGDFAQSPSGRSGVHWLMSLRCWYGTHGLH